MLVSRRAWSYPNSIKLALAWVMRCNPTTYAMNVVRSAFYQPLPELLADEAFITSLIATVAWTALTIAGSVLIVVKKSDV